MTDLQKTRVMIMQQLDSVDDDSFNADKVATIIDLADVLTKTYNTELRAKELELKANETSITLEGLDVFKERADKEKS